MRFVYYFSWTVVIGFAIYLGATYQLRLQQEASQTFNMTSMILFSALFSVIIGILLGLPNLIKKMKQNNRWGFDWIKFIAIGFPSLFVVFMYVLLFYLPENVIGFLPQAIFLGNQTIQIIAGVVFGYILLDSVKRNNTI